MCLLFWIIRQIMTILQLSTGHNTIFWSYWWNSILELPCLMDYMPYKYIRESKIYALMFAFESYALRVHLFSRRSENYRYYCRTETIEASCHVILRQVPSSCQSILVTRYTKLPSRPPASSSHSVLFHAYIIMPPSFWRHRIIWYLVSLSKCGTRSQVERIPYEDWSQFSTSETSVLIVTWRSNRS